MSELYQRLNLIDLNRRWHLDSCTNMIDLQINNHRTIEAVEQSEHLAESKKSGGYIPCTHHWRKHAIEAIKEPVMKCPRILRLGANLAPSNTVVNEVVNSTQRQPSRYKDTFNIKVEDINLVNSTSSTTSNSSSSVSLRAPRVCSEWHQPGLTYQTSSRCRVTLAKD